MALRIVERLEENILVSLLVGITLLVFAEVVMRFVFSTGVLWIQEVTLHASAWFVLFGASYGIKVGAHIGVDAFVKLLPSGVHKSISFIAVVLCLLYCALFLVGSWVYLSKVFTIGLSMEDARVPGFLVHALGDWSWEVFRIDEEDPLMPLWFAHGPLLVGFSLLSLRLLHLLWMIATGRTTGFHLADEAKEAMEHTSAARPIDEQEAGK